MNPPQPPTRLRRLIATYGPVAVVLLLGLTALVGVARERQRAASVEHTQRVQLALERTLATVRAAESRQRGYLLSRDSTYLLPYRRSQELVRAQVDSIRKLTADNPMQQERVVVLRSIVERRMERLEATLQSAMAGNDLDVSTAIRLSAGRALMDTLQSHIGVMNAAEDSLLSVRVEAAASQARFTVILVVVATLLAGLLALLANMILGAYAQTQEAASADLAMRNEQLADQAMEMELQAQQLNEYTDTLEQQQEELRLAALDLERRTRAAEEANRAKTDFLRAMSHELRTPLNAIGGYTQLIDLGIRGPVTAEQKADLSRIARSQRHLLSLINDILNYAKLEAGRVTYDVARIPIRELIDAVNEMVEPQVMTKGIGYTVDPGAYGSTVIADREKVIQIMLNLLSNAIKFTPSGGAIHVGTESDGDTVAITVRDTGPGIPPERQTAIFEPFVQVNRTLSDTVDGTGLGLSIARSLAQGLRGDLVVKSRPGEGSAFTLTLPMHAAVKDAATDQGQPTVSGLS